MDAKQVALTSEGYEKLKNELTVLKGEKKRSILAQMRRAPRGYIDRDEAEARYVQWEKRVRQIEQTLKYAKIVKASEAEGKVGVGSKVVVEVEGEQEAYEMVSPAESDPKNRRISIESPIGKAILGKSVGKICVVDLPHGEKMVYKVNEVRS